MRLDDAFGDRESYAHAGWLGGHEGLEQPFGNVAGESRTAICNADRHPAVMRRRRGYQQFLAFAVLHRLDGIAYQIVQNLLDLNLLHFNRIGVAGKTEMGFDAIILRSHQSQSRPGKPSATCC